jgi:membrane fusion protein (multidrug efflux system)
VQSVEAWLSFPLLLLLGSSSAAQAPQPQPEQADTKVPALLTGQPLKEGPKDDELRKLLKARYNEALVEKEGLDKMFQVGRASYDSVVEAGQRLLKAGLELCGTPADKVALLTQFVERTKAAETIAQGRFESGRASDLALHRLRYQRLDAEVQLLRAKREADKGVKTPEGRQKIVVARPQAKDVLITQQYVCQVHSQRHINVRALTNGYLTEISVKEGQAVKRGDVMFKVDPTIYQAKYDAELAEVRLAEIELNKTKKLFEKNAVSREEVALQQAKLDKARAKARLAEAELNFTVVKAPFDGIVDRLHEQVGSLVNERDILTTLSDNRVMWVYFNVPEARYLEYMAGPVRDKEDPRIELVLANGRKFPKAGKIGAIEANFNNETGNIPFRADFENPDGLLRHGQAGNVLIHRTLPNAIVIPRRAVLDILEKRYVYVVDKDDVAHRREVVIQNELEDVFVIKKGLDVNDRIVLEGVRQVRDGEKVELGVPR